MAVEKEKVGRKAQIYSTAERLFMEKGYIATSMRDLAEALGIEAASLYSHIESKEKLLLTIANRCADEFFAEVSPIFDAQLNTNSKLRQMIVAHIQVITRNLNASAVFFNEWKHLADPLRSEYAARREAYEDIFRAVVRKGIEENLYRNYDERFTTRSILSALNWTHTWYRADGELTPEQIGNQLADILLNGLIRNR